MQEDKLRAYFQSNYAGLSNDELDRCCANLRLFIRTVLAAMDYEAKQKLPTEPDSTK